MPGKNHYQKYNEYQIKLIDYKKQTHIKPTLDDYIKALKLHLKCLYKFNN